MSTLFAQHAQRLLEAAASATRVGQARLREGSSLRGARDAAATEIAAHFGVVAGRLKVSWCQKAVFMWRGLTANNKYKHDYLHFKGNMEKVGGW